VTDAELRALDVEVAVKVMGVVPREVRARGGDEVVTIYTANPAYCDGWYTAGELRHYGAPPPYSTQPGAAFAVVEAMGRWFFESEWGFTGTHCAGDWVPVHKTHTAAGWTVRFGDHEVTAPTFPLAVCKAALAALAAKAVTP
jgi:hypothetical protein